MPDWEFIAAICREAEANIDGFAELHATMIRGEVTEYGVIDEHLLSDTVREEIRHLLAGITARRPPSPAEAQFSRHVGRNRADLGIPLEALLGAYHFGYQLAWRTARTLVLQRDPRRVDDLMIMVDLLWSWLRYITSAVADGYNEASADREQAQFALAQTLVTALADDHVDAPAVASAARGLGLDPAGWFRVLHVPAHDPAPEHLQQLRRALHQQSIAAVAVCRGATTVVVVQDAAPDDVLAALGEPPVAGIGMRRRGLAGAAESFADGERAFAVAAGRGQRVEFETTWLVATLRSELDRLRPLLDPGLHLDQPHLAAAVRALIDNDLSVTRAAQALHLHHNTVKYRLNRWRELTGWDPHSLDGLVRSLLVLSAAPPEG
ncbi:PucR family transcriptional regulator [Actinoplanes sp. CA-054009]